MDELIQTFNRQLAAQGFATILLVVAIIYLVKSKKTTTEELAKQRNDEREARIAALEASRDECRSDRDYMRGIIDRHQQEIQRLWERHVELAKGS